MKNKIVRIVLLTALFMVGAVNICFADVYYNPTTLEGVFSGKIGLALISIFCILFFILDIVIPCIMITKKNKQLSKRLKVAEIWSIFYTLVLNYFRMVFSSVYFSHIGLDETEESRIARELAHQNVERKVTAILIIIVLISIIHMSILLNKIINEYKADKKR